MALAPPEDPAITPRRSRPRQPPEPRLRRARRVLLMAALLTLVVPAVSYVKTMLGPSSSALGVRSVEWVRDHGGAGLVSRVENVYYSLTAPAKGGPGLRALPQPGFAGSVAPPAPAHRVRRRLPYRPPDIAPILSPPLPGEGVWRAARPAQGTHAPVLVTTLRPSVDYPRLVAGVAWIDPRRTRIRLLPGLLEPAVPGIPRGSADVPAADRLHLLATFNSAFKLSDARGGVTLGGRTYVPLLPGQATLVGYADGRVDVRAWSGGAAAGPSIRFARQNLPLIVEGGRLSPNLSDRPEWGATLGNAIMVWRSGVGVDRRGDLLYAAANDLTVRSLAQLLQHAGAVRAMELDINSYWTSFITYPRPGAQDATNLLPSMQRSPQRYLSPDDRDFIEVLSRP